MEKHSLSFGKDSMFTSMLSHYRSVDGDVEVHIVESIQFMGDNLSLVFAWTHVF